ncbi:MAG: aspartate carbamoyltransferase [Patescibacteria group bacterium]
MRLTHVVRSQQFERSDMETLFALASEMETVVEQGGSSVLSNKVMASLFYEPSTRTRLSFEAAMRRLGGQVIGTENAREFSSAAKGETLEDTIRVIGCYVDVIVMRHYQAGSAEKAADISAVPIINAGDGTGQHPTQALLDVYTIWKEFDAIDGLTIAMVGDLANGRTVRSLAYLLSKFRVKRIIFVAPDVVAIKDDIKEHLREHKIPFSEEDDLVAVAKKADVIYQTRIQRERFGDRQADFEAAYGKYIIDKQIVALMPERARILHPLPRVNEITTEVDSDPRAAYFRQAQNGLYVRMALLKTILAPES